MKFKHLLMTLFNNTNEKLAKIDSSIDAIKNTLKSQEEKIKEQECIIQIQSTEIHEHSEKIKSLEISLRKKNILFHKVPETETSEQTLKEMISSYCTSELGVNVNPIDIEYLYRLGKKGENARDQAKTRPVLVAFLSYATKLGIIQKRSRSKTYGISEDFPKEVVETRRTLIPTMEKFRNEGKRVMLKVDKLIVDGRVWEKESDESNNKKRKGDCISPKGNQTKRTPQLTKDNLQEALIQATPTRQEHVRPFLKNNQRTPVCSPITKYLAKKVTEEAMTTALASTSSQNGSDNVLNQTIK